MDSKIKELKDLLFELDSKHSVSVPDTQHNINNAAKRIVKLFAMPDVVGTLICDHCDSDNVKEFEPAVHRCYNYEERF